MAGQTEPISSSENLCADPSFRTIPPLVLGFSLFGFLSLSIAAMKVIWFSPIAADLDRLLGQGVIIFNLLVHIAIYVTPVAVCFVIGGVQRPMAALGLSGATAGKGLLIGAAISVLFLLKNFFTPSISLMSDTTIVMLIPSIVLGVMFYEIFYRGFLLPALGVRLGFWPALFIVSALAVIIQTSNYLFSQSFDLFTSGRYLIETFVFSLIFGYLRCQTNSLWVGILPSWVSSWGMFNRIF